MFFQNLHCMFSPFTTLYQLDVQLQGSQYNLVGWYYFDMSFSQDNMKNVPNKIGPENFLYYILSWWNNYFKLWLGAVLCGGEMTFCPEQISLICLSSFFFVFFYTLIKMIITNSSSQVQGFIWMNKKEKGT